MTDHQTSFVIENDKAEWRVLFNGYADFYSVPMDDSTADKVWAWLLDPSHVLEGLVVRDANGTIVGFAHVRACPRTLGGCDVGFLDDMYVAPDARGSGASDALFVGFAHFGGGAWLANCSLDYSALQCARSRVL